MIRHAFLNDSRPLPHKGPENKIVQWHVFRSPDEADSYADHVLLGERQRVVGGHDSDSAGTLWWVGVEVEDVAHWGNSSAVHKHAE